MNIIPFEVTRMRYFKETNKNEKEKGELTKGFARQRPPRTYCESPHFEPRLPYSPDLLSDDYYLFPNLRKVLRGRRFKGKSSGQLLSFYIASREFAEQICKLATRNGRIYSTAENLCFGPNSSKLFNIIASPQNELA